jgi:mediator of RNA polymerase II transcription subunit 17
MPNIPDQFPISLRAWPPQSNNATALSTLISRINAERGSFRNITEESLREEIRKEEAGLSAATGGDGSEDEEAEDEEPDRMKEVMTAREQMLGQLEYVSIPIGADSCH